MLAEVLHGEGGTPTLDYLAFAERPVVTRGFVPNGTSGVRDGICTESEGRAQQTATSSASNCCGNPNTETWDHFHKRELDSQALDHRQMNEVAATLTNPCSVPF